MTGKDILTIIAVVALVTTFAIPAQQVVILKNGGRIIGEVTKTEKGYRILTDTGIETEYLTEQVLKIEDIVTPKDELAERLDKVDTKDAEGYYQVARWAYEQNLLDDAQKILKKVLKLKPDHENAPLLLKLVKMRQAGPDESQPATTTAPGSDTTPSLNPSDFLNKEDIYRIRLMELKPSDRVSIQYRNDVLNRFIKAMRGIGDFEKPGYERKFRGYSKLEQVLYIRENTDRENTSIRNDILIKSDPNVMKEFKTRIWPIIARTYAKPTCYGGTKGRDGLKLFSLSLTDDRVAYTNFYILHKWERGGQKMIDRDNVKMSLLLQYGLPRKLAKRPRPDYVPGPIFRSQDDRNYKLIENWIESLHRPFFSPGYQIDFKLPGQDVAKPEPPTTEPEPPTTKPADE
ncbi:MAG: hypothetical protein SVV80_02425 [Planctomycetota bacterium]|nr:hypothetical protein [Planctomycetota bacterium]